MKIMGQKMNSRKKSDMILEDVKINVRIILAAFGVPFQRYLSMFKMYTLTRDGAGCCGVENSRRSNRFC